MDDAGREKGQLQEAAAVERELLNLLPGDHLIDGVALDFDLRIDGIDRDGVLLFADLEVRIDGGDTRRWRPRP